MDPLLTRECLSAGDICLTLGGVRLTFEDGTWRASSELDSAVKEINAVLNERDHAIASLYVAEQQIQDLHKEIIEINSTKKVALDLLVEEKRKSQELQQQLDGYKAELADSFQTILQLRKLAKLE